MRHYLKAIIISAASLYVAYTLVPTIKIGQDPKNILLLIGGVFIISQIINPIFSLVLLPINHLTFGLVMFILNIALFYLAMRFCAVRNASIPGSEPSAKKSSIAPPPVEI